MAPITVWILGDQLVERHPALVEAERRFGRDSITVLMIESHKYVTYLPFQRKRVVLFHSAMRHYAAELESAGFDVDYVKSERFPDGVLDHFQRYQPERLLTMAAAEYKLRRYQEGQLGREAHIPIDILPNTQFLLGQYNPIPDPEPDKRYVMENFYRSMRRHFDVLIDPDGKPSGGRWNFDKENRQPLPKDRTPPVDLFFEPDDVTQAVMNEVDSGVGTVDSFGYAVTRQQALEAFDYFIETRLVDFGAYEDAMTTRSHTLYHSVISPYINIGLLEPMACIRAVEQAYRDGRAPINSVEGFIRQVIGWREFMYWQYWRQMPEMLHKNAWGAERPVPEFFWTGETEMRCLNHAITRAIDTGFNHHIERLMLLSNFSVLAGLNPLEVNNWFMAMYIDAYDWVMPPNVIGMGLNADDGLTATKPYIASSNYINKMGDMCKGCAYKQKLRHGEGACPFNYLYWNFILKHEAKLRSNPRFGKNVLGLRHLDEADRIAVQAQAAEFLETVAPISE